MEAGDRELVERAEGVEIRLWQALLHRLGKVEKDLLYMGEMLRFCRMLLSGVLWPGPEYDAEETRQELQESIEIAEAMLREVAAVG